MYSTFNPYVLNVLWIPCRNHGWDGGCPWTATVGNKLQNYMDVSITTKSTRVDTWAVGPTKMLGQPTPLICQMPHSRGSHGDSGLARCFSRNSPIWSCIHLIYEQGVQLNSFFAQCPPLAVRQSDFDLFASYLQKPRALVEMRSGDSCIGLDEAAYANWGFLLGWPRALGSGKAIPVLVIASARFSTEGWNPAGHFSTRSCWWFLGRTEMKQNS